MAASDSLRFPAFNFIKKKTWAKMFICEICKFFKSISWQNTSGWLLLVFISEFWEIFQITSFMEHLWETAYLIYTLLNFNHHIQEKSISQVVFKHFIQEEEVAIRRRSCTLCKYLPWKLSVKKLISWSGSRLLCYIILKRMLSDVLILVTWPKWVHICKRLQKTCSAGEHFI